MSNAIAHGLDSRAGRFFHNTTLALLTDFGVRDWYVAAMKAVAHSVYSQTQIADITHDIAPGDISSGAFVLSQCWRDFPPGTVFVCVVDPGVGSSRAPVVVQAGQRLFVGPDNGLFGWLGKDVSRAHTITNTDLFREQVTHTFHGRDIFAPVAAKLDRAEVAIEQVGPEHGALQPTNWPSPEYEDSRAFGQILYIDHYGNAITNLAENDLRAYLNPDQAHVSLHPRRLTILQTFSDAAPGQPLAYFGSGGLLEIAVNGGNAEALLDLRIGQHIEVIPE
ncbi:MAG: SAM hydrolase/SAM-dependent halogenase family protein [Puniceicoccales bacterium]